MENLGLALQLMVVGVVTVFLILLIVIQLSKCLIQIVNKIAPEKQAASQTSSATVKIDPQTLAVIGEAVRQITGGKGTIKSVNKI